MSAVVPKPTEQEWRNLTAKPIVKHAEIIPADATQEAVEVIVMAMDKYMQVKNYEAAAKLIKDTMDKKFGAMWHCAIGEGFGFDITYQQRNMIYVYYGTVGILCYKC